MCTALRPISAPPDWTSSYGSSWRSSSVTDWGALVIIPTNKATNFNKTNICKWNLPGPGELKSSKSSTIVSWISMAELERDQHIYLTGCPTFWSFSHFRIISVINVLLICPTFKSLQACCNVSLQLLLLLSCLNSSQSHFAKRKFVSFMDHFWLCINCEAPVLIFKIK